MQQIVINKKKYKVDFGIKVLRALGQKWELNSLGKVQGKIAESFTSKNDLTEGDLTFQQLDLIRDLFHTSFNEYNSNFPFKDDELLDYLLVNPETLGELTKIYVSTVQQNEPVDPNVRKGQKK